MKRFLYLILLIAIGCESNQEIDFYNTDVAVVQGYLFVGEPVQGIKISRLIPFIVEDEDESFAVNDVDPVITWNGTEYPLTLSPGDSGYYHYEGEALEVLEGETYFLNFEYEGKQIASSTTVPTKPTGLDLSVEELTVPPILTFADIRGREVDDIEVYWENDESEYYFVLIENIEATPASLDVNGILANLPARFSFVAEPTQLDVYNIRGITLLQYGEHQVKLFKVNSSYADLYITSEQDSRSLNEPLSNIDNGLGIFTSFNFAEDTFLVK